jgi:predicted ATPase
MKTIKIKGYKSFREIEVNLNRINLLIGSNGSGKSNFLSVFEMLGCAYDQRLASFVTNVGGVDKLLFQGKKVTDRIEVVVSEDMNSYSLTLLEADGRFVIEHERLGFEGFYESNFTDIASNQTETLLKGYNGMKRGEYIKQYMSQIRKFHFHDTGRRSPFTNDSHVINDAYRMYEQGQNLAAILYRIQKEDQKAYRRIIKVIQSVAPYFNDFYFEPTIADMIRLQWQDKYSSMIYGPTDLSDGTIRFIALATLFLQPVLPKVIIIDEPELGLHPVAIAKLAGLIKIAAQQGTQVIIATQSSELISNFTPEDVLTVNQRNGESYIERLDEDSLRHWLNEYTLGDLWKQNILKGGQPR